MKVISRWYTWNEKLPTVDITLLYKTDDNGDKET